MNRSGRNRGEGGSETTVVDRDRLDPRLAYLLGPPAKASSKPARVAKLPKAILANAKRPLTARAQAAVADRVKPISDGISAAGNRLSAAGEALRRVRAERRQARAARRAWKRHRPAPSMGAHSESNLSVLIVVGALLALAVLLYFVWAELLGTDDPFLGGATGLMVMVFLGLFSLAVGLGLLVVALAGADHLWQRWRARPRKRPTRSE